MIIDPVPKAQSGAGMLKAVFGLTATEVRVATCLLDGKQMGEIALEMHISLHTARSHLKQLFRKTGTRRQAELVLALFSAAGRVFPPL